MERAGPGHGRRAGAPRREPLPSGRPGLLTADRGISLALAGGGTGGHVVPGLHLFAHLARRGAAIRNVLWFGAGRPIEDRALAGLGTLLGEAPSERVTLRLEPEAGGAPSAPRVLRRTLPEVLRARRALSRAGSEVLLGLGGYTCLPAALAARSLGIPVALLEINATPGKATRLLAPLSRRVLHAWSGTLPARPGARHLRLGPPLAPGFARRADEKDAHRARAALGFLPERPLLLVLGGSQGALALNRFLSKSAPRIVAAGVQILHQVGPGRMDEAHAPFSGYRAVEYTDDVAEALTAATLVLSRGGASTLAEIAARARPALVVPYPHHRDRHQEKNARELGDGVRIVDQDALGDGLVAELVSLAGPEGDRQREAMERALVGAVPPDAGERLCDVLEELAEEYRARS